MAGQSKAKMKRKLQPKGTRDLMPKGQSGMSKGKSSKPRKQKY